MFITPQPKKYTRNEGELRFTDKIVITLPQGFEDIVPTMREVFSNYTAGITDIVFAYSKKLMGKAYISNGEICEEGEEKTEYEYELHIKENGATAVFNDRLGLIHALVSFLQLLKIDDGFIRVPCYSVWDRPDMNFRAIHLCVFKNTALTFLKKVFGLCGMMKLTHIVLEFWGTYRYECCPDLAWKGAYTRADIEPLVKYANGFGIELIPMLNHMGHASQGRIAMGKHSALDNNLRFAPLFEDDGWSWCTTNKKTLELLYKCRRELIELCGKGSYFHIGFDEAYTFASCERCQKFDRNELLKEHLINVSADLKTLGRRPIMWADMMLDSSGYDRKVYEINDNGEHLIRGKLPREIIMADWQYMCTEEFKTSKQLSDDGFDVVTCPWNSKENVDAAAFTVKNNSYYGVIGTTWHTLSRNMWLVTRLAESTWGETVLNDQQTHLATAYHIRRCVPAHGIYEDAGYSEEELPSISY